MPRSQPATYPDCSHPWVKATEAPLYAITYPETPSDEELLARQMELLDWYKTVTGRIAWVVDCTHILKVTPRQRRMVAEHLERCLPYSSKCNVAVAVVIPSTVIRGILTAIYWMTPRQDVHKVFADHASAREWALKRLEADQAQGAQAS